MSSCSHLLHWIIIINSIWNYSNTQSKHFKLSVWIFNKGISIFSPIFAPCIFNDPFSMIIHTFYPAQNFNYMSTAISLCMIRMMIWSRAICEKICKWNYLCNNWSIFNNFSFDILFFDCNTIVINFIYLILDSASIWFKMIRFAFTFSAFIFHTFFKHKSFSFSKI